MYGKNIFCKYFFMAFIHKLSMFSLDKFNPSFDLISNQLGISLWKSCESSPLCGCVTVNLFPDFNSSDWFLDLSDLLETFANTCVFRLLLYICELHTCFRHSRDKLVSIYCFPWVISYGTQSSSQIRRFATIRFARFTAKISLLRSLKQSAVSAPQKNLNIDPDSPVISGSLNESKSIL